MNLYEAHDVRRAFQVGDGVVEPLRGVTLSIAAGEWVAITGPSGSGKTSLLAVLGLLDTGYTGRLTFEGRPAHTLDEAARATARLARIGFVFQSFHLIPWLTARDNVAVPHWKLTGDRALALARADALLAEVGLTHRATLPAHRLSGGEQQRVAVARALANRPVVLLADEPTGNLDSHSAAVLLDLFAGLAAAGQTLVTVTHDVAVVARASRVIALRDGVCTGEDSARRDAADSPP